MGGTDYVRPAHRDLDDATCGFVQPQRPRGMSGYRLGEVVMAIIVAAMIVVPGLIGGDEGLNLVSLILIWGLFAIGFDLIFGMAGMLSFGHAAMLGAGGYALALLAMRFG